MEKKDSDTRYIKEEKMINNILIFIQPFTVIIFIIPGILSLMIGKYHQGLINLSIALANFIIFYGGKWLK